jgi:hypothetical protein
MQNMPRAPVHGHSIVIRAGVVARHLPTLAPEAYDRRRALLSGMVCCDTSIVGSLSRPESIFVAVSPETVYDLVLDVTRTGEWGPICTACWWHDEAERPRPGAWFSGRTDADGRT